jgi:hypothetical protein
MKVEKLVQFIKDELTKVGFKKSKRGEYQYKDIVVFEVDSQGISLYDDSCDEYGRYDICMIGSMTKKKLVRFYIKGLIEYQGKINKLGYIHYENGLK